MFRWWQARLARRKAIKEEADAYLIRQGWHAYRLAGERVMDAFFLGDRAELERWSEIRALLRDTLAPDASVEALERLLMPFPNARADRGLRQPDEPLSERPEP